jgi:hypothetical protein
VNTTVDDHIERRIVELVAQTTHQALNHFINHLRAKIPAFVEIANIFVKDGVDHSLGVLVGGKVEITLGRSRLLRKEGVFKFMGNQIRQANSVFIGVIPDDVGGAAIASG